MTPPKNPAQPPRAKPNEEGLAAAIQHLEANHGASIPATAKQFNVVDSTLRRRFQKANITLYTKHYARPPRVFVVRRSELVDSNDGGEKGELDPDEGGEEDELDSEEEEVDELESESDGEAPQPLTQDEMSDLRDISERMRSLFFPVTPTTVQAEATRVWHTKDSDAAAKGSKLGPRWYAQYYAPREAQDEPDATSSKDKTSGDGAGKEAENKCVDTPTTTKACV